MLKDISFVNKKVFITGSSHGIGLDIAKEFYAKGATVVINGRNSSRLKKAKNLMPKSYCFPGDVTNNSALKRISKNIKNKIGGLDILICNVGDSKSVKPGNETFNEFERMFNSNLFSAIKVIESTEKMLSESKGCIVCISSICGIETIPGAPITYSLAKSALNNYVKYISRPMAKKNIRINAIAPGNILFKGSVWEKKLKLNPYNVRTMLNNEVPLKKLGVTQDICSLTSYLASRDANFITGSVWSIDGGQTKSL